MIQNLLRSGSWAVTGKLFLFASNLVINILIVKLLTTKDVGEFFTIMSALVISATFANAGVKEVFTHRLSTDFSKNNCGLNQTVMQLVKVSFIVPSALILCLIAAVFLINIQNSIDYYLYGTLALYLLFNNAQQCISEVFRATQNIKWSVLIGGVIANTILMCALGVAWLNSVSIHVEHIFFFYGVAALLSLSLGLAKLAKCYDMKTHLNVDIEWRKLAKSAAPLFISISGLMLVQESYVWVTRAIYDAESLAIIGVAFRFVGLIAFPITILSFFISPIIANHIAKRKKKKLELIVRSLSLWFSIPALVLFCLFLFFGEYILSSAFGEYYSASYFCLIIICFGQLINVLTGCNGAYLIVTGQGKLLMKSTLIGGLLSLTTMIILGGFWSLEGVAVGYAIGVAFVGLYCANRIYVNEGLKTWINYSFNPKVAIRILTLK